MAMIYARALWTMDGIRGCQKIISIVGEEKGEPIEMGAELKPCPFCNGNAEVKDRYRKGVANRKMYWVECKKCGVSQAHHELAGYRTPNKAIAVWNHRW